MNYLNRMWRDIKKDFEKEQYHNEYLLSRKLWLNNGIEYILFYDRRNDTRQIGIKLENDYDINIIKKFPNWSGIEIRVHDIMIEKKGTPYLIFAQLEEYDSIIYEVVMENILKNLDSIEKNNRFLLVIKKTLDKWKTFFSLHGKAVMSEEMQQGLYGELQFLYRLIEKYGENSVSFWSGYNRETHDFYIDGNGIEVKTTSSNHANIITINNEFQLDNRDVKKNLFLYFLALRRSKNDGEKLSEMVKKITEQISNKENLNGFEEKLFRYGYIVSNPELYTSGFHIRFNKFFKVGIDFPKIIKNDLPSGVCNISYKLDLDLCKEYSMEFAELLKNINY